MIFLLAAVATAICVATAQAAVVSDQDVENFILEQGGDFAQFSSPLDTRTFFEHLLARQDQGIGGDASTQPPGVPFVPDIPFANNE